MIQSFETVKSEFIEFLSLIKTSMKIWIRKLRYTQDQRKYIIKCKYLCNMRFITWHFYCLTFSFSMWNNSNTSFFKNSLSLPLHFLSFSVQLILNSRQASNSRSKRQLLILYCCTVQQLAEKNSILLYLKVLFKRLSGILQAPLIALPLHVL